MWGTPIGPPHRATLTPYLGLDVLLRSSHQTGTAQPQHHHDGEEEAGSQDPARKARAPVTPHHPPPKKKDEFMAGHEVGIGGVGEHLLRRIRQVQAPPPGTRVAPLHLLGHAAEEVVLRLRGVRVLHLAFASWLLHGGLLPLRPGTWQGRGDAEHGHPLWARMSRSPSPCPAHGGVQGCRVVPSPPRDPLPAVGTQRIPGTSWSGS